ncbi:MAG: hypothetical protein CM15mP71_4760 [Candidatus Poseidoniales archaeon]|nr:MAG: hypothetical protein CM15mP71_4760 [Candidatus Poseidoniales archaeon]
MQGSWTGNGKEVYGSDLAQWGEVRLEMTAGSGEMTLVGFRLRHVPTQKKLKLLTSLGRQQHSIEMAHKKSRFRELYSMLKMELEFRILICLATLLPYLT